jgi:HEAT repeat protein
MASADELIKIALDKNNPVQIRSDAAQELGDLKDTVAVASLIGLLKDESDTIRYSAARSLGLIGDAQAVSALQALLYDEIEDVCEIAADSLMQVAGWDVAAAILVKALESDSAKTRIAVTKVFSDYYMPDVLEPLVKLLQDPVLEVRQEAILLFGYEQVSEAIPALIEAAHNKENEPIYWAIIYSLGAMRKKQCLPYIIEALDNPNRDVRFQAITGIGWQSKSELIPFLEKLLTFETDEDNRAQAESEIEGLARYKWRPPT